MAHVLLGSEHLQIPESKGHTYKKNQASPMVDDLQKAPVKYGNRSWISNPIGSMGRLYIYRSIDPIKINHSWIGKYTNPMVWYGNCMQNTMQRQVVRFKSRGLLQGRSTFREGQPFVFAPTQGPAKRGAIATSAKREVPKAVKCGHSRGSTGYIYIYIQYIYIYINMKNYC